jgi:hypothetical protein
MLSRKNLEKFCKIIWIGLQYLADRILPVVKPVTNYSRYSRIGFNFLALVLLLTCLIMAHHYMMLVVEGNFVQENTDGIEITGTGNDTKIACYLAILFSSIVLILSAFSFYRDLVWIYTSNSIMPFQTSSLYVPITYITVGYSLRIFLFTFAAIIGSLGADSLAVLDNGVTIFKSGFNSVDLSNISGIVTTSLELPFFAINLDMNITRGSLSSLYIWLLTTTRWVSVSFLLGTFWSVLPHVFDRLVTNRKPSFFLRSSSPHIEMRLLASTPNNDGINPGFQNRRHAISYFYTQNIIIPKENFYKKICDFLVIELAGRSSISLFLPGVGTGDFISYLLDNVTFPDCEYITIVGADASSEMLFLGLEALFLKIEKNDTKLAKKIHIDLILSGNLLDTKCDFYEEILSVYGTFDVVLSSQFDHYFPNNENSPLAEGLKREGKVSSTKKEYYSKCAEILSEDGIFMTIDDEKLNSITEQSAKDNKWDEYVVNQFIDRTVLSKLGEEMPWLERHIKELYPDTLPIDELKTRVATNRINRRLRCLEEICPKKDIGNWLKEVFNKNHTELDNPATNTHPAFFIFYVKKSVAFRRLFTASNS